MHPGPATRIDPVTGATERAGFLGVAGRRVFAVLTLPARPTGPAVVVCPSILHDIEHTDRREVALARGLAAAGMASVRFHPRGAGHSDDLDPPSIEALLEDAEVARAAVLGVAPGRLAVVGVRAGALAAARLAADVTGGAPLVVWEPAPDVRSFLKEGFRAARMKQLVGGATAEELDAARPPLERLDDGEAVALHGYAVPPSLLHEGATLDAAVRAGDGPVLLVQLGPRPRLAPVLRRLVDGWAAGGRDVGAVVLEHPDGWLVTASEPEHEGLVDVTVRWLRDRSGAQGTDGAHATGGGAMATGAV
jgi:hypothetical protein